ncbi:reverse transcriptase domain-containing protein [Tanacetum coccineum]
MRTHSQSHNFNCQQQQVPPTFVEPFNSSGTIDNQAHTRSYDGWKIPYYGAMLVKHNPPVIRGCNRLHAFQIREFQYRFYFGFNGVAYQGPTIPTTSSSPPKAVERETEVTKGMVPPTNNGSTEDVQPPVVQVQTHVPNFEPVVAPKPNPKLSIPYPSRLNNQKICEKANNQIEKFYQIYQDFHFDISFADALILMPKFASTLKSLISNKEKLFELARTPLNEHCSAVLLKKLPEKLRDPGKFLIPCVFPGMDECLALADLGASINLMPLSVWKNLSLPELTPTCMTLELTDRSISQPIEINSALEKEAVTFNLDQTSRYSSNYDDNSVNRIDVIDMACEEYSQEVLVLPIVIFSRGSRLFLALEEYPTSPEFDHSYYDSEGDVLLLEAFLNDDPSLPPLTQRNYFPEIRKELKVCKAKNDKSLIDEPLEVELKDLPPHLEYAFLEGDDKLPVDRN